jgi:hypothetical protein
VAQPVAGDQKEFAVMEAPVVVAEIPEMTAVVEEEKLLLIHSSLVAAASEQTKMDHLTAAGIPDAA